MALSGASPPGRITGIPTPGNVEANAQGKDGDMWKGDFGREYTQRNLGDRDALYNRLYGETAAQLYDWFFAGLPRGMKVLEVGCGSGANIETLHKVGIRDVTGVDIQPEAIKQAQEKGWNVLEADARTLPFDDQSFDMVFTSGVLIHVPPDDLPTVMDEIERVSKKYIHGLEYWAPKLIEVEYHGRMGLMWKGPYAEMWRERGLELRRYHPLKYVDGSGNVDEIYLMAKP